MTKIKTKEVYIRSVKQVNRAVKAVDIEQDETAKDSTPEEYAANTAQKQAQKTAYTTGRLGATKAIRRKNKKKANLAKRSRQAKRLSRISIQKAIQLSKIAGKAVVTAVKTTIVASKALILWVIEGGWSVLIVVLSICMIWFVLSVSSFAFWNDSTETGSEMQAVAFSQVGNIGGEPYWAWYGYPSRVEWCACFVSWCAEQCGYIRQGTFPKFSACTDGVSWFKERKQWQAGDSVPFGGMIIFFDWDKDTTGQDGIPDHTGIVKNIEGDWIYTIEGNSDDSVKINQYPIGHYEILGYGVPGDIIKKDANP